MRKWSLISIILVVLLLATTSFWLGVTPKSNLVEVSNLSSIPDFFLEGVHITQFDSKGEKTQQTQAKELKHYNSIRDTVLVAPIITDYQNNDIWVVSAQNGIIKNTTNDIILSDTARAVKNPDTKQETIFSADTFRYLNQDNILIGEGNISINSAKEHIQADTITAFLDSNTLEIKGSVRGTYETNN